MPPVNAIPDKSILQKVNQKLSRLASGSRNRITAAVRNGVVTLTGLIQFEQQRRLVVRAMNSVSGVRQVIDQLQISSPRPKQT